MNRINRYTLEPIDGQKLPSTPTSENIRLQTGMNLCNMDFNCGFDIPSGKYRIVELDLRINIIRHADNTYQFFTL